MEEKESTKFIFDLLIPCAKFAKIADLSKEHPLVSQKQTPLTKSQVLDILTGLVCDPDRCLHVLSCFKPIIAELVGRACSTIVEENEKILHSSYAISKLQLKCPFLIDLTGIVFVKLKVVSSNGDMTDSEIELLMKVYGNLVLADSRKYLMFINWNLVIKRFDGGDVYASRCLSMAADLADWSRSMPKKALDEFPNDIYDHILANKKGLTMQDGQIEDDVKNMETMIFKAEDIKTKLLPISGILLPIDKEVAENHLKNLDFILTESLSESLKALAYSLTTRMPVMIEGELGTGKTALLEYFAKLMGRNESSEIVKLQLGDQTDSKSILGIYICTENPGEFKWQAGTLTKAVQSGSWLILEDIDSAPLDVISVLIPLLEGKPLTVPGQIKAVIPAPGFKIFLTRRLHKGIGGQNAPSKFIEHLCTKVQLNSLSKEEIHQIVCKKHPHLESISSKLIDIYCMISSDLSLQASDDTLLSNLPSFKRQSTHRDFFKWCQRIAERFQNSSLISINSDVFQEAFSCFCIPVGNAEDRFTLAQAIGSKLGLSKDKVEFFVLRNKGNVQQTKLTFTVGRASLVKNETTKTALRSLPSLNYAFTRHAVNLLEEIAICVLHNEPVLLVGETGCGKTSTIQYLATKCGHKFSAINMSQQSDVTDLLGGFKPVDFKQLMGPCRDEFERLFVKTFSQKQNVKFLGHVQQCFAEKKWKILLKLMDHCKQAAFKRKGIKKDLKNMDELIKEWKGFGAKLEAMRSKLREGHSLAFAFVEGTLIKAIKNGEWILLDEINLATAETLECLSGLLESKAGSVVLVERGDAEPVRRHDDFRLFACMNPATDIGKKDLPFGIINRFTEIYVDELNDSTDLKILVWHYLQSGDVTAKLVDGIVNFYEVVQKEAREKLVDGTGHKPHYSLRTLCRALEFATRNDKMILPKAIYEGFCLSFLTQLDRSSHPIVEAMIRVNILGHLKNLASLLSQPIPCPGSVKFFCQMEGFWIEKGDKETDVPPEYVLTASVKENLKDLARVVSGRKYPVLLQGETSVGKTSLITYLARSTGNHCVRINNHEHTDIQEYIGCYSADENGKLVFKDGLLVDAMRKGYWIILDELNLAPTDVLEALNRLLDDNRELYVAETQETIKANPRFMLFATQNPPGQYGGRKILSRAFRNRFVELHFDEIPSSELQIILHKRCHIPRSYCSKFVTVMHDLQARRKSSGIFAGKHGFITLRDLFRWAERYRQTPVDDQESRFYDWDQHIAEDGYMLLAGRCRKPEEAILIQETIERVMKRKISLEAIYITGSLTTSKLLKQLAEIESTEFRHLVWTGNLQRMAVLVGRAIQFNEPVLLVGETGCGKTTVCQLFSHLRRSKLLSVNCHMHTESGDFIGGLRPVREHSQEGDQLKLFEWCDGPLVCALKDGSSFLMDEISLADDSVLERLNSVLETEKTLVLAEKGGNGEFEKDEIEVITAHENFRLMATMNPGGDFGKKELSPALRNRFTEIWCPQLEDRDDFIKIINHNVHLGEDKLQGLKVGGLMMDFVEWFRKTDAGQRMTISIRDLLSWSRFINKICVNEPPPYGNLISPRQAYIHGAFFVFIDSIGSGSSWNGLAGSLHIARKACLHFLNSQASEEKHVIDNSIVLHHPSRFGQGPFLIDRGPLPQFTSTGSYTFTTKTTSENTLRLMRAMQLSRPILLEGSPGVGKTSLVTALAKFSGHPITRINLSEQTDVTDLFGADLPAEGRKGGAFAWRDGPFLKALKQGQWIVLDELNLASQSVLEGLNACFDHRGEIYVPELGKSFHVQDKLTRIFACQNPLNQGGGRKGLPKSFLNRFTKVYVDPLDEEDLLLIVKASHPQFDDAVLRKMICFNSEMQKRTMVNGEWGRRGSPWEFNVRDVIRWCQLLHQHQDQACLDPSEFLNLIYADRMRTVDDKNQVFRLYAKVFGDEDIWMKFANRRTQFFIGSHHLQVGHSILLRTNQNTASSHRLKARLRILRKQFATVESLMKCIEMNWMAIIVGPKASGKTSMVEMLAKLSGNTLNTLAMNSNMDTTELLGGFEQVNLSRNLDEISVKLESHIDCMLRHEMADGGRCKHTIESLMNLKIHLRDRESENETRNPEIGDEPSQRFSDKLKFVEKMIDEMYSIGTKGSSKIDDVKERFDKLKARYEEDEMNEHAKGQFEWVDGILVKSLKQGDWLLIDNVNFCSPSVLDRLNGLLEPNGALTIDERGVQNEEIPTVKPHPNFRLFLSMDPKNGEISRAMRNRGIEIFIIGEQDGFPFPVADKMELAASSGIETISSKAKLVLIHEEMSKFCPLSVTELIKASNLMKELMDKGLSENDALSSACVQIYSGSQLQTDVREKIFECIQTVLQNFNVDDAAGQGIDNKEISRIGNANTMFPSVSELSQTTSVSFLKRDAIKLLLANGRDEFMESLACRTFLERATVNDIDLRLDVISMRGLCMDEGYRSFSELLIDTFKRIFTGRIFQRVTECLKVIKSAFQMNSHLILDNPFNVCLNGRLQKELTKMASNVPELKLQLEIIFDMYNRIELLLQRTLVATKESSLEQQSTAKLSMIEMSKQVKNGFFSASKLPHPVVELLHPFFTILGNVLHQTIENDRCAFSKQLSTKLLFALKWRDHFWKLCSYEINRGRVGEIPFQKALFAIHWKWIVDHLNPVLSELLVGVSGVTLVQELDRVIAEISAKFIEDLPSNWMSGLRIKTRHPPPFQSHDLFSVFSILVAFQQELSLTKKHQMENKSKSNAIWFSRSECEQRTTLYKCWHQYYRVLFKDDSNSHDLEALQTLVTVSLANQPCDDQMLDENQENGSPQLQRFPEELWLINAPFSIFAWLTSLKLVAKYDWEQSLTEGDILNLLSVVNRLQLLACYQNHEDFKPLALLSIFVEQVKNKQIQDFPDYLLPMLRAHVYEMSTFKLQKVLFEMLESENEEINSIDHQLNLFSNVTTNVIIPWVNKKVALQSKHSDSVDRSTIPIDWAINVNQIVETNMHLTAIQSHSWQHGGLLSQLPYEIWRHLFHDSLSALANLLTSLNLKHSMIEKLTSVPDSNCTFYDLLEVLVEELSSESLNEVELQAGIRNVLSMIAMFAGKEFRRSKEEKVDDESCDYMRKVRVLGELMSCVGLCRFLLSLPKDAYDKAEEAKIICHYYEDELDEIQKELTFRYNVEEHLSGLPKPFISKMENLNVDHFTSNGQRVELLLQRREFLIDEVKKFKLQIALRPNPSQYDSLLKTLTHFQSTIANHSTLLGLLLNSNDALIEQDSHATKPVPKNLQRRIRSLITSIEQFLKQINQSFPLYPDVVMPVKWALEMVVTGFSFVLNVMNWHSSRTDFENKKAKVEIMSPLQICHYFSSFPFKSASTVSMPIDQAVTMLSMPFSQGLQALLEKQQNLRLGFRARILHLALSHIKCDVTLRGLRCSQANMALSQVLGSFHRVWLEFYEEKKKKDEEEGATYRYKTKSHCSDSNENELNDKSFQSLFPSFERDYLDLVPKDTLDCDNDGVSDDDDDDDENSRSRRDDSATSSLESLTRDMACVDTSRIFEVLKSIANGDCQLDDGTLTRIFLDGYKEFCLLSSLSIVKNDPLIDSETISSNLLFVSMLKNSLESNTNTASTSFDIYHNNSIAELQKLVPLLGDFSSRVTELLVEFPEHPALIQIQQIIDRILSFPVNQPLMKYLTGLEILLRQSQDWESYSSSRVSIVSNLKAVTDQVIEWRKLELRCWPYLLEVVDGNYRKEAFGWLLKISAALEDVKTKIEGNQDERDALTKEVAKLIQDFIENSNLGEYEARLELIEVLRKTMTENDLSTVLWNIHNYYKQFSQNVNEYIQKFKSQIDKELKDFVKIAKWKDINFYAMKQTAEKSHRTLHKFIRKYEETLSLPVKARLNLMNNSRDKPPNQMELDRSLLADTIRFLQSQRIVKIGHSAHSEDDFLSRAPQLAAKMRAKCREYLKDAQHYSMVKTLDEFTGDVISNIQDIQSIDILNLEKEKRAAARKHLSLRKRKSLATLFKELRNMGLSYRKGIALRAQNDSNLLISSPVLCFDEPKDQSEPLSILQRDSHNYYFRCLARHSALSNALKTPSKELNPQDIERFKGYSDHLFCIILNQRCQLSELAECHNTLRFEDSVLLKVINANETGEGLLLPSQSQSNNALLKSKAMIDMTIYTLKQFRLLIQCCPKEDEPHSMTFVASERSSPFGTSTSQDEIIVNLCSTLEDILQRSFKLKSKIDLVYIQWFEHPETFLFSWTERSLLEEVSTTFQENCTVYEGIETLFAAEGQNPKGTLAKCVSELKMTTLEVRDEVENELMNESTKDAVQHRFEFKDSSARMVKGILTSIQELMKIGTSGASDVVDYANKSHDEGEADELVISEDDLFVNLEKRFSADLSQIKPAQVTSSLSKWFGEVRKWLELVPERKGSELVLVYPLINQYTKMVEYFLERMFYWHRTTCKLWLVLTGLFADLAEKGFCLPPDEEEAAGEGATEFEDIEGGGVGEGEGAKDVSDQIESEDQLHGAEQEGKEKEEKSEEDKNIPNEEHGIEMSEDFDGRMHDVDPNEEGDPEEEEEEEKEDNEEPDDKMGELNGMEEEKFDEKFWGDENDEDDGGVDENDKGPGADGTAQSELVAKEENEGEQEGNEGERDKKEAKEEEEEDKGMNELPSDENNDENDDDDDGGKDSTKNDKADADFENNEIPEDLELENDGANEDEGNFEENDKEEEDKDEAQEAGGAMDEGGENSGEESDEDEKEGEERAAEDENRIDDETGNRITDEDLGENEMDNEDDTENRHGEDEDASKNESSAQSSELQSDSSNVQNMDQNEVAKHAQNAMNEQQQRQQEENKGHGSSQQDSSEGHSGMSSVTRNESNNSEATKKNRKKDYKKSRQDRTLADDVEQRLKRLKTEDVNGSSKQNEAKEKQRDSSTSDLYQHVSEHDDYDDQTFDSATNEQAIDQSGVTPKIEEEDPEMDEDGDDVEEQNVDKGQMVDDESDETPVTSSATRKEQTMPLDSLKKEDLHPDDDVAMEEHLPEREGETRDMQSDFFTRNSAFMTSFDNVSNDVDHEALRKDLEEHLATWSNTRSDVSKIEAEAVERWRKYERLTSPLAQQLCEQLRLVLEPTLASKLMGDYRTGKRLNMRKVIPYIASQFRKDKIWLRRTKKSRREYQILLAVDDSSSMGDNHSKQLAFESLAVISNALTWLEAGQFGICSFGETTKLLHSFTMPFNEDAGAHILHEFTFTQRKTHVAMMLDTCAAFMTQQRSNVGKASFNRVDTSQLLIIVSDGRGIFLEGKEVVESSVRRAREAGIFIVFVVLDNPSNRDSILDIKIPIFKSGGGLPEIISYIDEFPFPFYLILRDINALPTVLCDALRQWFELVINST